MTNVETLELPNMPEAPAPAVTSTDTPKGSRGRGRPRKAASGAVKRPGGDAARKRETRSRKATEYRKGITGMLQMLGMPLLAAGKATRNPVLVADAAAVSMHAEPLADAVADLAVEDARIAAVLDKLTAVGPYGALIGAVMPLAVQLAANHGMIAAAQAEMFGAVPMGALLEAVDRDIAQAAAEAQAQADAAADDAVTPPASHVNGNGSTPSPAYDPTEAF